MRHICIHPQDTEIFRQISNIRCTESQNLNVSHLVLQLSLCSLLKPGVNLKNEDVVGAAPTGNAPTTSKFIAYCGVTYI